MPKRQRKFGELSKQARDRAARAGRSYGLTRRQVRERYNRGTYNPLSTDNNKRVPLEYRRYQGEGGVVDWREAALDRMRHVYEDYFKFNDDAIVYYNSRMDIAVAYVVANATEDELLQWASVQPDSEGRFNLDGWAGLPPDFTLDDVTVSVNGIPHNIFWYH